MLDTFKDPRLALAAYNAGPGVFRRNFSPANQESIYAYVRKVIRVANRTG